MNRAQFADLSDEFDCPVCLETMQNPPRLRVPKLLQCSHSVCASCLPQLVKDNTICCPLCKFVMPYNNSVPNNTTMIRLIDALKIETRKKQIICGNCEQNATAFHYCLDCPISLCEDCFIAHSRMKSFKRHKVSKLEELETAQIPLPKMLDINTRCNKHEHEIIDMYCETCQKLICRDCIVLDHPVGTHKVCFLGEAVVKYTGHLQNEIAICVKYITQTQSFIDTANAAKQVWKQVLSLSCANVGINVR